jgi:hypothetical protein
VSSSRQSCAYGELPRIFERFLKTEAAGPASFGEVLGGRRYLKGYEVECYFCDVKVTQIYDGAGEILKVAIARRILTEGQQAS